MSETTALRFESLRIDRAPGIPRGEGFALDDLQPGINVIHGPNGIGKSTTARAIQCLLWPDDPVFARPSVEGRFTAANHRWDVEVDAGHLTRRRDGRATSTFGLAPPELRDRYHLALHDLIADDAKPFARQVARAMAGDYDVPKAAGELGLGDSPTSTQSKVVKQFDQARQTLKKTQEKQKSIDGDSRELSKLEKQRDQARQAQEELGRLDDAEKLRKAREQYNQLKARLDQMPPGIDKLHGDEGDRLDQLKEERDDQSQKLRGAKRRRNEALEQRDAVDLPEGRVPEAERKGLHTRGTRLQVRSDRIRDNDEKQATEHHEQARRELERLTGHLEPQRIEALEPIEIEGLNEFAARCESHRATWAALTQQRQWLEREIDSLRPADAAAPDHQALEQAALALANWLASPAPATPAHAGDPGKTRRPLWLAAATAGALAIVLAALVHPAWAIALVPAAAAVAWGHWPRRGEATGEPAQGDPRAVYRAEYERLNQPPPETWEPEPVAERMRDLQQQAHRARLRSALEDKRSELAAEEQAAEQKRSDLDQQREEITQALGAGPKVDEVWLGAFIEALVRWQEHHGRALAADAAVRKQQEKLDEDLRAFGESIARYGGEPPRTLAQVDAALKRLDERAEAYRGASDKITDAERDIGYCEENLQRNKREWSALFEPCGLAPGRDEPTLRDWLAQREDYLALSRQLAEARGNVAACKESQSLVDRPDLQGLSAPQITQRRDQHRALAERFDELDEEIRRIRAEVDHAKQGHALTEALAKEKAAAAALDDQRDADAAASVGAMLAERVRLAYRDQSRPRVLDRADQLLARITGGRLSLRAGPDQPPTFRAVDRRHDRERSLDELSTGERVQLLLAVRVGFVECEEAGARLPLLMDETLGTSDNQRAQAIMDAVIELARQGRQVFYFTAQRDEVSKWQARLESSDVPHKLIDLAALRRGEEARAHPLPEPLPPAKLPPAPGDMNRWEYAQKLEVPAIKPMSDAPANVHLWHVIDDPGALHRLLCQGIERLGDALTLIDRGGEALTPELPALAPRLRAASKVIGVALEQWRIGRGRPIDRAVLQDSGAVSDTFIDDADALARSLDHDPAALLEAIRGGALPRWRENKTEQLRGYLLEHGYLDERQPLPDSQLRTLVLAATAAAIDADHLDAPWVDRLLASLPDPSPRQSRPDGNPRSADGPPPARG